MLNRIVLIGRLTRDPELRYTPSGVAVTTFTLAVSRPYVNQQGEREADFINIVTWRGLAETCANDSKGTLNSGGRTSRKPAIMKIARGVVFTSPKWWLITSGF